jgi:hypothetical protein
MMDAQPNPALDVNLGVSPDSPLSPYPPTSFPVSLARKLTASAGTQEENFEWLPHLTDGTGKRCIGRDPMSIPVEVLTAAGHPPRETRRIVGAFVRGAGGEVFGLQDIRRHKDIRRYCLRCVENAAEVRRCSTINCPFWPYRMGRNPHNPMRGSNPFTEASP